MRYVVGIDEVGRAASLRRALPGYIIGIDEVGRGSLAGPVVVAALALPRNFQFSIYNLPKLRDSKKLTVKQREAWSKFLCEHPRLDYAIARVYPRQIEKRNIARAANVAALRAFERLMARCQVSGVPPGARLAKGGRCQVFLDGGLYLGNKRRLTQKGAQTYVEKSPRRSAPSPRWSATTVVLGDEKIKAISAASIIAKVHRDRGMVRLAKKYPQYGFEIHKGYGTKKHMAVIEKHGPSEAHRLTFL